MIKWSIQTVQPSYKLGEKVHVKGKFLLESEPDSRYILQAQLRQEGNDELSPTIETSLMDLKEGAETEKMVKEFLVTNSYPPGEYELLAGITKEGTKETDTLKTTFQITETAKPHDIKIAISSDREAQNRIRTFKVKEHNKAYIKIDSLLDNLELSGTCVYPNSKQHALTFEDKLAIVELGPEGVYKLTIKAQAKGYRDLIKNVNFNMISASPKLNKISNILKRK